MPKHWYAAGLTSSARDSLRAYPGRRMPMPHLSWCQALYRDIRNRGKDRSMAAPGVDCSLS